MRILITGSDGFLGREFTAHFSKKYDVISANRSRLDVSKEEDVKQFFLEEDIDVILHTAFVGGKLNRKDTYSDFCQNIQAFNNIMSFKDNDSLLFCFGSGASYDRSRPIKDFEESMIFDKVPLDYYGSAKNIISRSIKNNVFDFRLFGCFGKEEGDSRFIKSSLNRIKKGDPIIITQNKMMDFFYVGDLCKVIDHYINNQDKNLPTSMNMVYNKKYTLVELGEHLAGISHPMIISGKRRTAYYTGDGSRLSSLNLRLTGLFKGIEEAKYVI